ncbi:MAG: hypothetical protein KDA61_08080 [Planctomycetales bacterium]|nr:hypothetical protein [Planctomycetales bacterium]
MNRILPPLIVGEVLFDCFPNHPPVLGGAPFNVAWNLQGLGKHPVMLTGIGEDSAGEEIVSRMKSWGLSLAGVQRRADRPTGRVEVEFVAGEPRYDIVPHTAYDSLEMPSFPVDAAQFSLLYAGTLAWREPASRTTLRSLLELSRHVPRFIDLNVRMPWFDEDLLPVLLAGATWIKLNSDELELITKLPASTADEIASAVASLRERFGEATYLVTCGEQGAFMLPPNAEPLHASAPSPETFVDAVGAGDAFSAAMISGLLDDLAPAQALDRAVILAARTCGLRGATTSVVSHYQTP